MNKLKSGIRKTIQVMTWIVLCFVLLLLALAVFIQIPAIQTKVVQYATTFVSSKTHTKVELEKVNISFPKSIVVKGLYLEDTQHDTLLYTGRAIVNISLLDLFSNKINISSFDLNDAVLNLYNTKTLSAFNYDFLTSAFSDTTNQEESAKPASKWVFNMEKVHLQNFRLTYNDNYAGMNVDVSIKNSKLKVEKIDLNKSLYSIKELSLEGMTVNVLQVAPVSIQTDGSGSIMPLLSAKKLQMNNAVVSYIDSITGLSVFTNIEEGEMKDALVDLQEESVTSDAIFLSKSEIRYHDFSMLSNNDAIPDDSSSENNWTVAVNTIRLSDNQFNYKVGNKPALKQQFDSDHLNFTQMQLMASKFFYAVDETRVSVQKFSAIDQNGFVINNLETDFKMDENSISTKSLKITTPYSKIDADFYVRYASLDQFTKDYYFSDLKLNMRSVNFKNHDVLYFSPDLISQPFFTNKKISTFITGNVSGALNHLNGKNIVLQTGEKTRLETDFIIRGLPEIETAFFNFPNLRIQSGKKDILTIAGSSIPENIGLPESVSLQTVFKGKMNAFETRASMTSSFGNAKLTAAIDASENFKGKISLDGLDLGQILNDTLFYGPVSLSAEVIGQGLNEKTVTAKIKAEASQLYINQYAYQNFSIAGTLTGRQFDGNVKLNDEYAVFDFDGLVDLTPGEEKYNFRLNIPGANLKKLHFTEEDIRLSFNANADFEGNGPDKLNGKVGVNDIIVVTENQNYVLDSFNITSVNEAQNNAFIISSPLIDLNYSGTVSPGALPEVLAMFVNNYFPVSDSIAPSTIKDSSTFNFDLQLYNHPLLSEVLLPNLSEFSSGMIKGSFDSGTNNLELTASAQKIVYESMEVKDLLLTISSNSTTLKYQLSGGRISNAQFNMDHLEMNGDVEGNTITNTLSMIDAQLYKKLLISSKITKEGGNYKIAINPADFYLMNDRWDIAADNYIEFGKEGFLIHKLFLKNGRKELNIESVNNQFNDDLKIDLHNFMLLDVFGIIAKDTSLVRGKLDGNVLMKKVNESYGMLADISLQNLSIRTIPIGTLTLQVKNKTSDQFNIDLLLSGADNNLNASGYFIPDGGEKSIYLKAGINSLSMKTLEAFSMGQITETSGMLTGGFLLEGNMSSPQITGQLEFTDAFLKPAILNNRIELKHETVQLKNDGLYFNNVTISDVEQNTAIIDGAIKMEKFSNIRLALTVNTKDFLLLNTSVKDSKEYFGQVIIDSEIAVSGPLELPLVQAHLKLKEGSNFTFVVPEDQLTTDKGENVVEFETDLKLNTILYNDQINASNKSSITGFDVSAIVEIDKAAKLRLLMDPASSDSLVVKGEAALSFTMDQSGQMSLTGTYNLSEGSYQVSLESIIKKKFDIKSGSTITWNGDPLDATISIDAQYLVRTSPYNLVSRQLTGLSDAEKGQYKQQFPFIVLLKLRGKILQPEISFEIQLPPDEKGILAGSVNQKLTLLNEDPSTLNKQVFALLVLNRFVPEDPFQAETGGASSLIRTTVSRFLSAQLNQLSSKVIPGVELNFDIQSYEDYQTGQAEGRTQVEIGMKKQLFNERLSVQLGGTVDVEGENAKQNSAGDITSDVKIEYKLNKDGNFRLKGFRHNQYEGAIEGQLVETGVGVVYVKDFDSWKGIFGKKRKSQESSEEDLK